MHGIVPLLTVAFALLLSTPAPAAGLTPLEQLGKSLFFDKISSPDKMACADCHAPSVGWTGPVAGINAHGAVYRGAVPQRFGNRKPPSSGYATLSPTFHYDAGEGLFEGGNFWDGRATGERLGNPAADQALGPFLNPVEQNNPGKRAVLEQVASSRYAGLWKQVWGTPIRTRTDFDVDLNYDRIGLAIAAYEGSSEVNAFSSKFDFVERGLATLTPQEQWGRDLFEGKGNCAACHPAPLFTDFTYDNLGTPKNPENPFYDMDRVYLDGGQPINPAGPDWIDPGLGGYLASLPDAYFAALGLDKAPTVAANFGKHKVPTLRNVDLRPGNGFPKAYMHNGVFKSLKEVVHFYNTRDVAAWDAPEAPATMNTGELGDLGLTPAEEDAIVAFLGTLSDGFVPGHGKSAQHLAAAASPPELTLLAPGAGRYRVAFVVPAAGRVRLTLYDLAGRRLRTLFDDWSPGGRQAVEWSAAGLANGLYFVRLDTGRTASVGKVVVRR